MKFSGVIFDLDGTLLDTIDDLADSMNHVLESFGCPTHTVADYRFFVGDGMRVLAQRVLPEQCRDADWVDRAIAAMEIEYGKRWHIKSRPYAGVAELLDELTARAVPMAILTNKPQDFARLTVERLLSPWCFDPVRGMRLEVPLKPDPAGAIAVAKTWGIEASTCLYAGDTDTDMLTAVRAGMRAVGVTWGFRPREELLGSGAEILIDMPQELLSLL